MIKFTLITLLIFVSVVNFKAQTQFVVDPTFNIGTGFSAPQNGNLVNVVKIQPDGKILVGGAFVSYNGITCNRIVRLNIDGSIDQSFSSGTGFNAGQVYAITIQNDGKILVGGSFTSYNGTSQNRITRLLPDGSIDVSFTQLINPINNNVRCISVQNDGKIIVGGNFTSPPRNRILRLEANGSLDQTFNVGTGFTNGEVFTSQIQDDGKILVGGDMTTFNGLSCGRITRLNSDGSIDASFNCSADVGVRTIVIKNDGKIIIGGFFTYFATNQYNTQFLGQLYSDGSWDSSFNYNTSSLLLNGSILDVKIQPNSKMIIGGSFTTQANCINCKNRINSVLPNSALEPITYTQCANALISSIALQNDGKIIIGGAFTTFNGISQNYITRLIGDCIPSATPTGEATQSFCSNATVSDLIANGINVQWYSTSIGGAPLDISTPLVSGNNYYASQTETCESTIRLQVTVTITQPTTPTFTQIPNVCSGGIINLPNTSNNNITGSWSPAVNNTTTTSYTFIPNPGQCASNQIMNVVVNQLPNVSLNAFNSLCDTAGIVTLTGGNPVGGIYSGTSVTNNAFNAAIGVGTYPITYSYTDNNGCSKSATKNLSVILCSGADITELKELGISLYPNPTSKSFSIESTENNIGKLFEIHDVSGRVILSSKLEAYKTQVTVSDFETGTYYLKVPELEKVIKFLKQ
jgi:uncharacterized delta-60 repeat protein